MGDITSKEINFKRCVELLFVMILDEVWWPQRLLSRTYCYYTYLAPYHFIPLLSRSWGQVRCQMTWKSSRKTIVLVSATFFQSELNNLQNVQNMSKNATSGKVFLRFFQGSVYAQSLSAIMLFFFSQIQSNPFSTRRERSFLPLSSELKNQKNKQSNMLKTRF